MEPSVGKGLRTHLTQQDVVYGYLTHRTQGPGRECQDTTLLYLTQATFLLMLRPDASNIFFASYASCAS